MSIADPANPPSPTFVIVGHVNRGKSAVVSTLAADDSVAVDPTPGTTRTTHRYPMTVDGRVLYTLIDTPGFERPRQVRDWLRRHETRTGDSTLVRRFVEQHEHSPEFEQEVRLLRPIIEGGCILYIVNSAVPFSEKFEAEMEILRYTGRPRMALINRFGGTDFTDEWLPVLDKFFSLTREFDAHHSNFAERIALLRTLRELDRAAQPSLDAAIAALQQHRADNLADSAHAIASALSSMLTATREKRLGPDESPDPHKPSLQADFLNHVRSLEADLRARLRSIYAHKVLNPGPPPDPPRAVADDLFAESTWSALGLSRTQLLAAGAGAGALIGGSIDLAVGGLSFFIGTAIGAAAGSLTSLLAFSRLASVKVLGQPLGGTLIVAGPVRSPQFPWIILDRAILFHDLVSRWAHGRRESPPGETAPAIAAAGVVAQLPPEQRKALERAIAQLHKPSAEATRQLAEALLPILIERDRPTG